MTKEALFEDLVVKRSDDGSAAGEVSQQGEGGEGQDAVWHQVAGADDLTQFSWTMILTVIGVGSLVLVLSLICCCCLRRGTNGGHERKKKKPFGIKRTGYLKDKFCTSKPTRNPTPVSNPDRGSHYLKKSPSPTGIKSPPGGNSTMTEEYLQRKALITTNNQTKRSTNDTSFTEANNDLEVTPTNEDIPLPCVDNSNNLVTVTNEKNHEEDVPNHHGGGHLGKMISTVRYCFEKNALVVTINRCENLPAKDSAAKSSDPYVKLQLLPEKQHKVKTRVMRRTLNPVYDEDFTFYGINFNQLQGLTLHYVVLSFDRYSRDDVIGEVMVDLDTLDLSSSDHQPISLEREIMPRSLKLKSQSRGEILVSLCHQPAANRITAVVLKARNLPKMDITGLSDPYVKIYLLFNGQRIAKKKTHVKKRTLNPVFNESFVFDLPHLDTDDGLNNVSLEFLLLDWDRVTKNEVIGRLDLGGPKCTGSALHHWNEVISSPRRQIAEWHKLLE